MNEAERRLDRIEQALNWQSGLPEGGEGWRMTRLLLLDLRQEIEHQIDQDEIRIGWVLKRKVETEHDTRLFFERVITYVPLVADVRGTGEVGTSIDRGMGAMFINVDHEEAELFVCGQQYVFGTDCIPLRIDQTPIERPNPTRRVVEKEG